VARKLILDKIDDSLSKMRLRRPGQIALMQSSLEAVGQLQPIVVRANNNLYQLLDGFKRYYASRLLKWDSLQGVVVEVDEITGKALILSYNQHSSCLIDYEEAQILYSLKKDHSMGQRDIALLISKSISWVSRRLSFIERLDEGVGVHLQLGKITATHARELVKLPRGKQQDFLKIIVNHNISSRGTAILITRYLQSKTSQEHDYLLAHPLEIIEREHFNEDIYDSRLSFQGNRLLKTLRILAHWQYILIGQSQHPPLEELTSSEKQILSGNFSEILNKGQLIKSLLTNNNINKNNTSDER